MALFTAKDVAALREKTGCGMMDCKKALTEAEGNIEAAIEVLREKGLAAANKKSGRVAAEGIAFTKINQSSTIGAIIEVNTETDFVAKNKEFQNFVELCADTVIENNPKTVAELLEIRVKDSDKTIQELLQDKILTIGENIKIRRFERYEGVVANYMHAGGRIGVMVNFEADTGVLEKKEFKSYGKDIAMQIAAINPSYLEESDVPADVIEKEKRILRDQVLNEGKPEKIVDRIVEGKMKKYYKENCLLDQVFVKDNDITVDEYTKRVEKSVGTDIKIKSFVRFETGEGLEKRAENFADEVAGMIN